MELPCKAHAHTHEQVILPLTRLRKTFHSTTDRIKFIGPLGLVRGTWNTDEFQAESMQPKPGCAGLGCQDNKGQNSSEAMLVTARTRSQQGRKHCSTDLLREFADAAVNHCLWSRTAFSAIGISKCPTNRSSLEDAPRATPKAPSMRRQPSVQRWPRAMGAGVKAVAGAAL